MIKLGDDIIETVSLQCCRVNNLCKTVYPAAKETDICPLCGGKLFKSYRYACKISDGECILINGSACFKCDSFFSCETHALHYIEKHCYHNQPFEIRHDFDVAFDDVLYESYFNKKSAFMQIILNGQTDAVCYTLVYKKEDEALRENTFYFAGKTGAALLRVEKEGIKSVQINGEEYLVLKINKNSNFKVNIYD